jgi:hypothetical protein
MSRAWSSREMIPVVLPLLVFPATRIEPDVVRSTLVPRCTMSFVTEGGVSWAT